MSPVPVIKQSKAAIRLVVVVLGLSVFACAGYFLLVQSKKNQSSSLSKEITQLSQQVSENQAQAQQAAGLSKILVADYFKLMTAMPDETDVPQLLLQLDTIARNTGVSYESTVPGSVIDASSYQVIPITLTFQGNFYDLSDFLHRLQSLVLVDNHKLLARGRLFTVDQITFGEGDKGFPSIKATIQVDAYAFGHPVTVAAAPSTGGTETSTTSTETTTTASAAEGAGS